MSSIAAVLCEAIPCEGLAAPFSSLSLLAHLLHEFARRSLVLLALYAGLANISPASARDERPAVYDTGYEIVPLITTRSLYWVDNEQLLFFGMKAGRGPRPDVRKLYIWDSKTKMLRFYADGLSLCFSNGFISYRIRVDRDTRTETVREGPLGSESEITRPFAPKGALHSNLTCRSHLRSDLAPIPSPQHVVAVLRNGDGYLDLGPHAGATTREKNAPMRNVVVHKQIGQAVQLPMTWEERFSPFGVVYSAFHNAYVLVPSAPIGISGPWPKGQPLKVYLVRADGATEAISIPYSPTEFLTHAQPVRSGWIYGGGNVYKASGLYLFDGHRVSKVDAGFVEETAVSPNGCKAAAGIKNDHLKGGMPTNVRIFDLCR